MYTFRPFLPLFRSDLTLLYTVFLLLICKEGKKKSKLPQTSTIKNYNFTQESFNFKWAPLTKETISWETEAGKIFFSPCKVNNTAQQKQSDSEVPWEVP